MDATRRRLLCTLSAAGSVGAIAGCLGDGSGGNEYGSQPTGEPTDEPTGEPTGEPTDEPTDADDDGMGADYTVGVADHPDHGELLVDSEGMTLYLFTQDEPGESVCYDDCAENWPPLTVEGDPSGSEDLPGNLGTVERDDGTSQVTYNGWPLYYWVGDDEPGDATGHEVNDVWFVVAPDEEPLEDDAMDDYTVGISDHPDHGEILVDAEGMTLYLFTQDEPGESVCYDDCAENWPPLLIDDSPTGSEDLPGDLSTAVRTDGEKQVTYNEWPLYYWVGDDEPGDATGHEVNDVWFVVAPDEEPPEGADEPTNTETDDGYDYDY